MFDAVKSLFPQEAAAVEKMVALFTGPFAMYEVWDAMEGAAVLGRKAEMFLEHPGPVFGGTAGPAVRACISAASVTSLELCEQLKRAVADAPPAVAVAEEPADADPLKAFASGAEVVRSEAVPKAMNPFIASLVISLVQRLVDEVARRLTGR